MKNQSTTVITFKQWKMEQFYKAFAKAILKRLKYLDID
jgi:hypothetical protein